MKTTAATSVRDHLARQGFEQAVLESFASWLDSMDITVMLDLQDLGDLRGLPGSERFPKEVLNCFAEREL